MPLPAVAVSLALSLCRPHLSHLWACVCFADCATLSGFLLSSKTDYADFKYEDDRRAGVISRGFDACFRKARICLMMVFAFYFRARSVSVGYLCMGLFRNELETQISHSLSTQKSKYTHIYSLPTKPASCLLYESLLYNVPLK